MAAECHESKAVGLLSKCPALKSMYLVQIENNLILRALRQLLLIVKISQKALSIIFKRTPTLPFRSLVFTYFRKCWLPLLSKSFLSGGELELSFPPKPEPRLHHCPAPQLGDHSAGSASRFLIFKTGKSRGCCEDEGR